MMLVFKAMAATMLTLSACSEPQQAPVSQPPNASHTMPMAMNDMGMTRPSPGDSKATLGLKASMSKMMDRMPPFTGDADRDFMLQMRVHHIAAVEMATVQLDHGRNVEARALAQEIIAAQRREIAQIDAWLKRTR